MNINESCKKATEENKFIQSDQLKDAGIKIKPTNTEQCCVYYKDNIRKAGRWNPSLSDLIDESYEVVS